MNYGRYQIVRELGKGSMGVVYEAYDPNIDRTVALKVLRQDLVTSEEYVERFLKEARAIGRLSHPNIVIVHDVGKDKSTVFIAMEFLTGVPLNKVILEKRFSIDEIVKLGIHVAEALDYANKKGIVHRDIKPSNIMVMADDRIKITDFGIAHIEEASASQLTQAGEILGTPVYMSPEQVMAKPVDGRSDLFSLGSILYELATGKRPFQRENMAAVLNAVAREDPAEPAHVNPEIPQGLSDIITKCLKKEKEERFQTGGELAEALKDLFIKEDTVLSVRPDAGEKIHKGGRGRSIFLLFVAAVISASIIGGGLLYFIKGKGIPVSVQDRKKISVPISNDKDIPGKENSLNSLKDIRASDKGTLDIKSVPLGARVIVDGEFRGIAPLKLPLPLGKHEVRVTLTDYYDWEAQIQLKEEGETPILAELMPIN